MSHRIARGILAASILSFIGGCTSHPAGERRERDLAAQRGQPYARRIADRTAPLLPAEPSRDDLVRYAYLASPELEQRYWEWRAAIEQTPQDGTQPTNLVLFAGVPITRGSTAFDRTTVTASNDPMADIQWPSKPATAALRALEAARAAGFRFQDAKLTLRQKVLSACYDVALATELARLERENERLLTTVADVAEQELASGKATQTAALSARNDADLSHDRVGELQSRLPGMRAALNAAIGRMPGDPISPPTDLPEPRATDPVTSGWLTSIEQRNPQLVGLDAELRSRTRGVELAKLQYKPDFSLSGGTDLGGIVQNLAGMVTLPFLRHEAIDAAIAQAEANVNATASMKRQIGNDLVSNVIADLATADDLRAQLKRVTERIVPRAAAVSTVTRVEYESGRSTFAELVQAQRTQVDLSRLEATLKVALATRYLAIERSTGIPVD